MAFKFLALLFSTVAFGQLRTTDFQQSLSAKAPRNYIKNSGMEKNDANVTDASSIASRTTTTPLEGVGSLLVDASAGSQLVVVTADDFQAGMLGKTCEATFQYSGDASLYTAYVTLAGNTVSATQTLLNTGLNSQNVSLIFPCGASTTDDPAIVIASTGNGAAVKFDSFYLGEAVSVGSVAQARALAKLTRITSAQTISATTPVKVQWNSAVYDYEDGADTTTNYRYTFKSGGVAVLNVAVYLSGVSAERFNVLIYKNGSIACTGGGVLNTSNNVIMGACHLVVVPGDYVEAFVDSVADNSYAVEFTDVQTYFDIAILPTASEIVVRGDVSDLSGFLKSAATTSCAWTTTSATMASFAADADCPTPTFSGNLSAPLTKIPAAVANNLRPGRYLVFAQSEIVGAESTSNPQSCDFEIYDGTNSGGVTSITTNVSKGQPQTTMIIGQFNYDSFQTNKQFEIRSARITGNAVCAVDAAGADLTISLVPLNQPITQPLIPGSVFSDGQSVMRVISADITTTGGACSINSQTGSSISSVTHNADGDCTVNIASGTFSSAPFCVATPNVTAVPRAVIIDRTTTPSATAQRVKHYEIQSTPALIGGRFNIYCIGAR